jgi:hypothetical protein
LVAQLASLSEGDFLELDGDSGEGKRGWLENVLFSVFKNKNYIEDI